MAASATSRREARRSYFHWASNHFRTSIRVRLAVWYAVILAAILAAFSGGSYLYFARATSARIDRALVDHVGAFTAVWEGEREEDRSTPSAAAVQAVREFRFPDRRVIVIDDRARVIAVSGGPPFRLGLDVAEGENISGTPLAPLVTAAARGLTMRQRFSDDERNVRAFASRVTIGSAAFSLIVLQDATEESERLSTFRESLAVAIPIALLLSAVGGYWLARASLAPVMAMSEHADQIGASNLHERLELRNTHDELDRLGAVFNRLLARVEDAFERQRRFMTDASHELRTPVAIIRSAADVSLARSDRGSDEYRDALRITRDAAVRMARIVDDLFMLARADAEQYPVTRCDVYLEELIVSAVQAMRPVAAAREIAIVFSVPEQEAPYSGDPALLQRLLLNLLDNAVKFSPVGGRVTIVLERDASDYRIAVTDTGHGIPEAERSLIFRRFYQVASSRSQSSGSTTSGAGLGLSIARWIVAVHGGSIALAESGSDGSTFLVRLPRESATASPAASQG